MKIPRYFKYYIWLHFTSAEAKEKIKNELSGLWFIAKTFLIISGLFFWTLVIIWKIQN